MNIKKDERKSPQRPCPLGKVRVICFLTTIFYRYNYEEQKSLYIVFQGQHFPTKHYSATVQRACITTPFGDILR